MSTITYWILGCHCSRVESLYAIVSYAKYVSNVEHNNAIFFFLSPKEAPLATQRVYSTVLTLQSTYMLWRKEYAVCSSGKGYSLKILQTLPQLLFPPDKWKWSRSRSKIQRQGFNLKQSAIIPLEGRGMSYTAGALLLRKVMIFRTIKISPGYYFE